MDFKGLLKDKFVLALLVVVILNAIAFGLVWRLDIFVNGDLYDFGLIMSSEWANDYWYSAKMLWTFLAGTTALAALSIIPHYMHGKEPSRVSKWLGFLLPSVAFVYQGLCIVFLMQIGSIVQNRLYDYGLPVNFDWTTTYNPINTAVFALMVVALLALIIPVMRTLELIEIEIVQEEFDIETESLGSDDQKSEKGPNLTEIRGIGPKRALELERAGVKSVSDLAKLSPENLAEKTGLPIKQISKWIREAKKQNRLA